MTLVSRRFAFRSFVVVLFTAGCGSPLLEEIVAPEQPAPVDNESAPRSTDFDTDGESLADKLKLFPTEPAADEPDTAVDAKPEPEPTNPFDDLSIAVQGEQAADDSNKASEPVDLSEFHEGTPSVRERLEPLYDGPAPALAVSDWMHSEPMELADLQGKIVVLDFWATWCGPCLRAIPHTNELAEKYADQGVVVIGVCAARGSEKLEATVAKYDIQYPVAVDNGSTVKSYRVNGFPDYHIIDRSGKIRIADCRNSSVEDVIKALLAEEI